jgi:hypothetical protein
VQSLIKELHEKKILTLFIKLDITKAFDSISWDYLLDLMEHLGFRPNWREWNTSQILTSFDSLTNFRRHWPIFRHLMADESYLVSSSVATSSSHIQLKGVPGRPIKHERGLRQGDPVSPMLFILAMEPLQKKVYNLRSRGTFFIRSLQYRWESKHHYMWTTLILPCNEDILSLKEILKTFGDAMGLRTNLQKQKCFQFDGMHLI